MAAALQPTTVFIRLNGNNLAHYVDLNTPLKQSHRVLLAEYMFRNVPMTGLVATHDFYSIALKGSGIQFGECLGDLPYDHSQPLGLEPDSENTLVNLGEGLLIGRSTGSSLRHFEVIICDPTGARHHPSTNKLFDTAYIKLMVTELAPPYSPLMLQSVPTVVQAQNTA
jgi:hypothetical protein